MIEGGGRKKWKLRKNEWKCVLYFLGIHSHIPGMKASKLLLPVVMKIIWEKLTIKNIICIASYCLQGYVINKIKKTKYLNTIGMELLIFYSIPFFLLLFFRMAVLDLSHRCQAVFWPSFIRWLPTRYLL